MTTVINTPRNDSDSSGFGILAGVILSIALIGLFIVYAVPAMRNKDTSREGTNINVQLPDYKAPAPTPTPTPAQ